MRDDASATPTDIRQRGPRHLAITWADGHASVLTVRELRLACRCARCIDEWSGAANLDDSRVPADVHPLTIEPVGRYGIQIDWSDGHATGIYPYRNLRALCPCDACAALRE